MDKVAKRGMAKRGMAKRGMAKEAWQKVNRLSFYDSAGPAKKVYSDTPLTRDSNTGTGSYSTTKARKCVMK